MNSAINYAEQPGVHDVLARKSVNDVVALNNYELKSWILVEVDDLWITGRSQCIIRSCLFC